MNLTPTQRRWAWNALWLALAVFLVLRATSRREERGVILSHLEFGRRLLHGVDVYGPDPSEPANAPRPLHAPYPPSFGLLTAPFAVLDDTLGTRPARAAWALLQIGCLMAAALSLRRLTLERAPPGASPHYWNMLWALMFALGARFVLRDTHGGGGNVINLALCLLAFTAAERGHEGRAGLWLGISLATKPTQLWLLPVFWLLGRRRTVGATILTGLGCVLLSLLLQRFDFGPWYRWIEGSWRIGTQTDAFAVPALDFPAFEWMNQCLRCAVARWFGTVPPEFAARVAWGVMPGLGLSQDAVTWITRVLSLGGLALVLGTAWRTRRVPEARLWVFASALVLSVLLSPLSWKAHHMALLPALFLLVQRAGAQSGTARTRSVWLLVAWAVFCLPGKELIGNNGDEWQNSLYVITIWDAVLVVLCTRSARAAAREHEEPAARHSIR